MAMKIYTNIFIFLFSLFFPFQVLANSVDISVDKRVLTEADILTLTVSYNGDTDENPDLSGLQKDFRIVSTSTSQQINYINGTLQQTKQWAFGLQPLHTGKITINPIKIGGINSNYEEVEVKEVSDVAYVPDSQENTNSPYFQINLSYSPESPYLQQQTTFLVTIYDSLGLQDSALSITEETKKNWSLLPLTNQPIIKKDVVNNKKVNAITYVFAGFPLKNGSIPAPQFLFDGYYLKNSDFHFPRLTDSFSAFGIDFNNIIGQRVPVNMKTKKQSIFVKSVPNGFTDRWLPLTNLEMQTEWTSSSQFKAGEAANRKITITATGISEEMFPALNFSEIDGFKQYPEKPIMKMSLNNGELVTTATYNIVYIPTKSGKHSLPAQEINWFNTRTGRFEKTSLPSETITVLPNNNISEETFPPSVPAPTPNIEPTAMEKSLPEENTVQPPANMFTNKKMVYILIAMAFFFGFALFGLLLWLKNIFSKKNKNFYRKMVISSIKKGDYKAAQKALFDWGSLKFGIPSIANLKELSDLVQDDDFSKQLDLLNAVLYSGTEQTLDVPDFLYSFKKVDKKKQTLRKNKDILPNLYD